MDPFLYRSWRRFALLAFLLITPVGGGAIALCLSILGICVGAVGSGVFCSVGYFSGYFEGLLMLVELGMLIPYSYVWIPIGFILILAVIVSLGFALHATFEAIRYG